MRLGDDLHLGTKQYQNIYLALIIQQLILFVINNSDRWIKKEDSGAEKIPIAR